MTSLQVCVVDTPDVTWTKARAVLSDGSLTATDQRGRHLLTLEAPREDLESDEKGRARYRYGDVVVTDLRGVCGTCGGTRTTRKRT